MQDNAFLAFIKTNATGARGGATYNLATRTCSKQAREILANTKYNALARANITSAIVRAYTNNAEFKAKLDEVMQANNITVIAPRDDEQ